ncbi:MAG: S8 family peptidase [Candidatus Neomarinimicrobiota bacterium]
MGRKSLILVLVCIAQIVARAESVQRADQIFANKDTARVWVYIRKDALSENQRRPDICSDRTQRRLQKIGLSAESAAADFIPDESFRAMLSKHVTTIRHYSKILCAFSCDITRSQYEELLVLQEIESIAPVGVYRKYSDFERIVVEDKSLCRTLSDAGDYGNSYQQLAQLNIPAVHDSGLTGNGVRIAIFDTGFKKDHPAFQHILDEERLIAEYDFIFNDENVQDEIPDDTTTSEGNQSNHGTAVWSEIGAYVPGTMIGAAYKAEFLLAKTERLGSETSVEEDNYVAAIEWADRLGVDVISTSLGYRDFDNFAYSFADLDGETAVTTKAVNWAFRRGIIVAVAAGNEGNNPHFSDGGINSPTDAFGALSAGAVDGSGVIAGFSSHGPTADGRIKPDLCAKGVSAYLARDYSSGYGYGDGTSFATPLIAGAAALVLEKNPDWSPAEVILSLKKYADRANAPDDRYGWGIPDVWKTIFQSDTLEFPDRELSDNQILCYPNPAAVSTNLFFKWDNLKPSLESAKLEVIDMKGKIVWSQKIPVKWEGVRETIPWDLLSGSGLPVSSGIYFVRLSRKNHVQCGRMTVLR